MSSYDGGTFVSDLLQVKNLFGNYYLSDVLFVFSMDPQGAFASDGGESSSTRGHLIPAHRLVLSFRSGAFQMAFLKAKSSHLPSQVRFPLKIHVQDTPYHVFYSLLKFLYTNELYLEESRSESLKEDYQLLLRAAYVYLVPSLVAICVQRIADTFDGTSNKVETTDVDGTANGQRQIQMNTLEILVFLDTLLATKSEKTDVALLPNKQHSSRESEDVGADMLSQCTDSINQLQELCFKQLQHMEEVAFKNLLQSDIGRQSSTKQLCEILRLRSETPLIKAIRYQLGRVVHELLRQGEPLDRVGKDETDLPLVVALQTGNNAIIRRLLIDETAPFLLLTETIPLLFLASASGYVQHCQILIAQNPAEVNYMSQVNDGDKNIIAEFGHQQTPLHIASRKGHCAVVELLLQHHAASNLPDDHGNTALHYAANIETVKVLLDRAFRTNANIPNKRGRTPLHIAAARGHVDVVAYLICHGAERDLVDDQGQNAFHHAAANGHTAVALVLLQETDSNSRQLAIGKSNEIITATDGTVADELRQQKVEQHDSDTVLATEDEPQTSRVFDINQEDLKGNTALHLAAMSPYDRCQQMLQFLLENNADPNRTNWFGYTPLHMFCSHQPGPASLIQTFITHGANIHAQSVDGSTALHLAVGRGSEDVAVALVSAGAFVQFLDAAGRSVVDLIETINQGSMVVPVLRNLSHAPESNGDDQSTECASCHTTFRLAMRKYFCRHCGRTMCHNCSINKIAIPKFQLLKPDRVCNTCFDVLSFRKLL